jgi:hypothetical protein
MFPGRYIQFIEELVEIDADHEGLTGTDVRERIRDVINYYFTWGNPIESDIPRYFFMYTPEGDAEVFKVTFTFIIDALICAQAEGLDSPEARHQAMENPDAVTSSGHGYWDFLGSTDQILAPKKPLMGEDYWFDEE